MDKRESEKALKTMLKARMHLLFDNPFIGSQAIKFELIPTNNYKGIEIKTAAINGKVIVFNPSYVNRLSFNQAKFLIAHETFHVMLKHHIRRSGRDFSLWNESGDYAINDILLSENIGQSIDNILVNPDFSGMSAEKIYSELYQEQKENKEQIADNPAGSVLDCPADIDHSEIESEIKETIQNALNAAKRAGKMPGSAIQKIVDDILAPKANWKELLKNWLDNTDKTDVSFIRPKDRGTGFYSPGFYSESLNKIAFGIDVSYSIIGQENAVNAFQTELNELKRQYQFESVLIYFHEEIERVENIDRYQEIKIEVKETGGTRIKPVFDYIFNNGLSSEISGLIVFTDMEIGDFPETEPGYKVLWCQYGNCPYMRKPDIGEIINITE